jgi:ketosteroid isomerase-like protein
MVASATLRPAALLVSAVATLDVLSEHLELDEVTTRRYGDCAVTTARRNARGTAQGHALPAATRVTFVAVDEDGDWRLSTIHFSFIAGTPGPGPS